MKFFFISLLIALLSLDSATAQSSVSAVSVSIAKKMKDSLGLNTDQFSRIQTINENIAISKSGVRTNYSNHDSIKIKMQLIENTRDSLYQPVLSSDQFLRYREKKKLLVSSN